MMNTSTRIGAPVSRRAAARARREGGERTARSIPSCVTLCKQTLAQLPAALTVRTLEGTVRAMDDRQRLTALLAERSARRGQFTLASGRVSTLYIDARLTTMSPDGLALIGPLALRSEERRVGKEGRSRWWAYT